MTVVIYSCEIEVVLATRSYAIRSQDSSNLMTQRDHGHCANQKKDNVWRKSPTSCMEGGRTSVMCSNDQSTSCDKSYGTSELVSIRKNSNLSLPASCVPCCNRASWVADWKKLSWLPDERSDTTIDRSSRAPIKFLHHKFFSSTHNFFTTRVPSR